MNNNQHSGIALLLLLSMMLPMAAHAQRNEFSKTDVQIVDNNHVVSADIAYSIPDAVIEALQHGVVLQFATTLQAIEGIPWWPDRILYERTVRRKLSYHLISKKYVVTDLVQKQQHSYYALPRALQALGDLEWQIPEPHLVHVNSKVRLHINNYLDIDRLPLLLQLVARTNQDWRTLALPLQETISLTP